MIARERAARALQRANDIEVRNRLAAPKKQTHGSKSRSRTVRRTTEQQLVHMAWDSEDERAARTAAFVVKQELEHLEAEARKAQAKLDDIRRLEADASAAAEAAAHRVPPRPTLAEYVRTV